jgi:trans-aconitate methyltransferase
MSKGNIQRDKIWAGPKYRRESIPANHWPTALFDTVGSIDQLRVAQVGAGEGRLTAQLATGAAAVLALEFDQTRYSALLRDPRFAGSDTVTFQKADPCALPSNVIGGPYDLVVAHAAVERCQRLNRFFYRLIRLATPHTGTVYAELAGSGDMDLLYTTIETVAATAPFDRYFRTFRFPYTLPDELYLRATMEESSYGQSVITRREESVTLAGDQFVAWIARWGAAPWLDLTPESKREAFLSAIRDAYPSSENGEYTVTRSVLSAYGKRLWGELSAELFEQRGGGPISIDV